MIASLLLFFVHLLLLVDGADICEDNFKEGPVCYVDTQGKGQAVILLHGARFTHQSWCAAGSVQALHDKGFRVVAPDVPGYGKSKGPRHTDYKWILKLMDVLQIEKAFLVAASMSGLYALPLAAEHPEKVLGLVGAAPVGLKKALGAGAVPKVPSLFVYGDSDPLLKRNKENVLQMSGQPAAVILKASHACYLDDKEAWNTLLLEFLQEGYRKGRQG